MIGPLQLPDDNRAEVSWLTARQGADLVARDCASSLLRALADRSATLGLHVAGLEAATLIELTAFGTAVAMHWRYLHVRPRGMRGATP